MKRLPIGAFFLLFALAVASPLHAGPPELLVQLALHPSDPDRMVLRYEESGEGLMFSDDAGTTWRAMCASAVTLPNDRELARMGRVALAGDGTLLIGNHKYMLADDETGCGVHAEPSFEDDWVTDITNHPSDPEVVFAITSTTGGSTNGVSRRDAQGAWEAIGTQEELLLDRLAVATLPNGELRFYVSGTRGTVGEPPNARPNYVIRVSDDMGDTWTEHVLEGIEHPLTRVALQAVDPTNPDRVVLSAIQNRRNSPTPDTPPDRLLVSTDRGATFSEYLTMTQFGGLDMAPDGRLWVGDLGNSFDADLPSGLYFATTLAQPPDRVSDALQVSCVTYHPQTDRVFVCQRADAGFVNPDGTDYAKSFAFNDVAGFVACDDVDMVARCETQFVNSWCGASHFPTAPICCPYVDKLPPIGTVELPICDGTPDPDGNPDGGAADPVDENGTGDGDGTAGPEETDDPTMDAEQDPTPASDAGSGATGSQDDGGCGCHIAGSRPSGTHWAWLLTTLAFVLRLRRSRRV